MPCFLEPVKQNNSRYVWPIAEFVSNMCLSYPVKFPKLPVNVNPEMCWEKYFLIKDDAADEHKQNQQWTPRL